jgi:hypothetical protein
VPGGRLRGPLAGAVAALALAAALVLGPAAAQGATLFAPDLRWRTIVTPHFRIHYHQGLEAMALRLADVAEAVHERESGRLGWTPATRTHVVLVDETDLANGYATPIPYNQVVLFATPPDGDTELVLNSDDWLYTLFLHEYTHTLHLDRADGPPLAARSVFGRLPLLFPNAFNPKWMIEGLAVYEETEGTRAGRGRGSIFQGILRTQAAEGRLVPLDKANHPIHTWPGGQTPYLYGAYFLMDLAENERPDAPFRLVDTYSDHLFPFLLKTNYRQALGGDLRIAWRGWQHRLAASVANLPPPAAAPIRLTRSGYLTGGGRFTPDGRALVYTERTPNDHGRILLMPPTGDGPARELAWRNGGRDLAFTPGGARIVFSQPEVTRNFRLFDDLYTLDPATGRTRRLTRGARLREPDVAPDGRVVAVANTVREDGGTALVLLPGLDAPATPSPLYAPAPGTVFAHPRFSPDGSQVAVSVWRPGGGRQIALVDPADGSHRDITAGPGQHADPTWSPDGRHLLYTADPDGVFNLYARDTDSGATFRVTHVRGAALAPEVSPDGTTILYTGLHGEGFDLYRIPFDPATWVPVETPAADPAPRAATEPAPPATPVSAPRPYRPYPAALPRFWLPVWYTEEPDTFYGFFTLGNDPLAHHVWVLQAAIDPADRLPEVYATYLYDRFLPTVQLSVSQDFQGRVYTPSNVFGGWVRERDASVDLIFPVNHFNHRQRLQIGVGLEDVGIKKECSACVVVGATTDLFLRLGVRHDSTQHYGLGISDTDGRRIALTEEIASDEWGSDRTGTGTVLDWREFVPLPRRAHVIGARLTGAATTKDLRLAAGGPPNAVEDAFDRDFAVRGFPEAALVGDRLTRGTLSWRFPLGLPEWAPGTLPLFLEKLHGNLFLEGARVHQVSGGWKGVGAGGAELGSDFVVGYFIPFTLRLGVAVGGGPLGEVQGYLRVEGLLL